ncbi:type VI secretion system baseplate subunit TssF [Citrobacter portucalensis]|nr:type VI secretion system baseplate subunit TssF [Citrobacter portucalensis]MCX9063279.1 type VI secretion system baseplate subunit TssF [Citrobacter portucalensis]
MNDLLSYYQKELNFLKRHGKIFAARFPKIARRLGIVEGESEDPHVSRLVESFALLTSRIHQRLDEDIPEVVDALLATLAPQFLRPLPSVCIVMLSPDPLKSGLTGKNVLPADTSLFTRSTSSHPCKFQTVYPVALLPISICDTMLYFDSDTLSWRLKLKFQVWAGATLASERIRLYLHGPVNIVSTLYTLLCSEIKSLNLYHNEVVTSLAVDVVTPVGFRVEEALLTREPRIAPVHILLMDYFWFPQRFSFIDIQLPQGFSAGGHSIFELQVQFQRNPLCERLDKLAPLVDAQFFRLHCTPAVNLFSQRAEPIMLTETVAEYPVVPDARNLAQTEVWAVQQVTIQRKIGANLESFSVLPLLEDHAYGHSSPHPELLWQSHHRSTSSPQGIEHQAFISFCNRSPSLSSVKSDIATLSVLCSNGGLAYQLPYGCPEGDFDVDAPTAGLNILALTHPTRPVNPPSRNAARWRFLSQLSLNHQLLSGKQGAQQLKETLALYNFDDTPGKIHLFTLIKNLQCEPITARLISNDPHSLARGIALTLTFDHEARMDPEYYLLCSLLDHLLALYAPVNSFTRLTTCIEDDPQTQRVWPIRAGGILWL